MKPIRALAWLLVLAGVFLYVGSVTSYQTEAPRAYIDSDFAWYEPPEVVESTRKAVPRRAPAAVPAFEAAAPSASPTPKPTRRPTLQSGVGQGRRYISGTATWYCEAGRSRCPTKYPDRIGRTDNYAAAGPRLRQVLGRGWRGEQVLVCYRTRCVEVTLVDWCRCKGDRVIDLFGDPFRYLAPLSRGTIKVTVGW